MSKPQTHFITVFITEGNPNAIQVTAFKAEPLRSRHVRFPSPESALAWCRKHQAAMVYSPSAKDDE